MCLKGENIIKANRRECSVNTEEAGYAEQTARTKGDGPETGYGEEETN